MFRFFLRRDNGETERIKVKLVKELFGASTQKKTVTKAARESAADQQMLLERYRESLRAKELVR